MLRIRPSDRMVQLRKLVNTRNCSETASLELEIFYLLPGSNSLSKMDSDLNNSPRLWVGNAKDCLLAPKSTMRRKP